jgi:acyl-CoA reductase-like NAD-dependent aldehyde dehydrogenase
MTEVRTMTTQTGTVPQRARVQKAYKLYIGGQFVRSESGRYKTVTDVAGDTQGTSENIAWASRKDGRDAVRAAMAGYRSWAGRTAFNRGQILYRLSEVMEGRSAELQRELVRSLGLSAQDAQSEVEQAIDRVVCFAGWSDKIASLLCSSNPVGGPHFNFSVSEPMGVVAVVAPEEPSLLGLVTAILQVIVSGNSCVVLCSDKDPRTAITFAECLATSDMPGGVVNLLTGTHAEVIPHLAKHMEIAGLSLWSNDNALIRELEIMATDSVKRVRVFRYQKEDLSNPSWESLQHIERFVEFKTIWHPMGL